MQSRDLFYTIYIETCKSLFLLYKANLLDFTFLFLLKYKETHIVDSQPPSPLSCKSWSSTKNTRDGNLIELTDSKTSFGTNNKVKIDYLWPTSKSGFVQNSYLNKAVIFYDFLRILFLHLSSL